MNTEFLARQINIQRFFTLLCGISGWLLFMILAFYFIGWIFTSPQLCGYYLVKVDSYRVKSYWKYGFDSTVYETYDGKEALEVLKKLNEQFSPLRILPMPNQDKKDI